MNDTISKAPNSLEDLMKLWQGTDNIEGYEENPQDRDRNETYLFIKPRNPSDSMGIFMTLPSNFSRASNLFDLIKYITKMRYNSDVILPSQNFIHSFERHIANIVAEMNRTTPYRIEIKRSEETGDFYVSDSYVLIGNSISKMFNKEVVRVIVGSLE